MTASLGTSHDLKIETKKSLTPYHSVAAPTDGFQATAWDGDGNENITEGVLFKLVGWTFFVESQMIGAK